MVKYLIFHGADVDITSSTSGDTVLAMAAYFGDEELVELLLSIGADKSRKNLKGESPLDLTTSEKIKKTLSSDDYHDFASDRYEPNKLIVKALAENKILPIIYLLSRGASIDSIDLKTQTILFHQSAGMREPDFVKMLLNKGIPVDIRDSGSNSALHIAVAEKGNEEVVKILLDHSKTVDIKNIEKNTPLHIATSYGNVNIVKMLIKRSKDIDSRNKDNETALHLAAASGNEEIVKILIANSAVVYKLNKKYKTPLDLGIESRNKSVIKLLLVEFLAFALKNDAIFESSEFQAYLGYGKNLFFLKENYFMDISLLQYVVDQKEEMTKELEEILLLLIKIDKFRHPGDLQNSEFRVKERLRKALPSSSGLRECISSVQRRYSWGPAKMWFMRFFSILKNIMFGWTLYFLDLVTDLNFSLDMFNNAHRNYTNELSLCKQDMVPLIEGVVESCKEDFDTWSCHNALKLAEQNGQVCLDIGKRFNMRDEWYLAGVVSLFHCFGQIVFALIVFLSLCLATYSKCEIFKLPIPIVTKLHKTIIEWKLFSIFSKREDKEYLDQKEKFQNILKDVEQIIILSMVIEASLESCFQFWFQTSYLLPSLMLSIVNIDSENELTDLFNVKILSIFVSFLTFAWASIKIR